jgi:hypothetical protein
MNTEFIEFILEKNTDKWLDDMKYNPKNKASTSLRRYQT